MKNLWKLFNNFFDHRDITHYRIRHFGQDALIRLNKANTSHQYDAVIADLAPKVAALDASLGAILTDIAQQKGTTYTAAQVMDAFINEIRMKHGGIRDMYRDDEKTYLEFYPQGLNDYRLARSKDAVAGLMARFAAAINAHAADFDAAVVTLFTNFPGAFKTAIQAQSSKMVGVSSRRTLLQKQRKELNESLYVAVFTAGAVERGNISKLKALFNFSLLLPHSHSAPKERYQGSIQPDKMVTAIHDTFPEGTRLRFRNLSKNELKIGSSATADAPVEMVWQTLKAGKTKTYKISQLLSHPDDTYILISNPDLNDMGLWQIERWVE